MGILFHCPDCLRPLNVQTQLAGQPGICPGCKETILVPPESSMLAAEFRTRLRQWSDRQKEKSPESGSADLSKMLDGSNSFDIGMHTDSAGTPSVPIPKISKDVSRDIAKPGLPGSGSKPGEILTESQKVAQGIAGTSSPTGDPLAESGDAVWYVRPPSGGQFGPASASLVRQWITEGRVTSSSYIWCEGWDDWRLASNVFAEMRNQAGGVLANSGVAADTTGPTAGSIKARGAYLKARRRRTMWGTIVLLLGTIVVITLLVVLFTVIQR